MRMHIQRKVYNMKHKFFYRLTIIILTVCLITQTIDRPMKKVEAAAFAIPLVWEILQYILLGAGVSYFGYVALDNLGELIDRLTEPDTLTEEELAEIERMYYEQIASLNAAETGLGDALNNAISAASIANGAYTITISQAEWEKLRGLAEKVAREPIAENRPSITMKENIDITNDKKMLMQTVKAIPDSMAPYIEGGQYRVKFGAEGSGRISISWESFIKSVAMPNVGDKPYISAYYIAQEWDEYGKHKSINTITYIVTDVEIADIITIFGTTLSVEDASGNFVKFVALTYEWDSGLKSGTYVYPHEFDAGAWDKAYMKDSYTTGMNFGTTTNKHIFLHSTDLSTYPLTTRELFLNSQLVTTFPMEVLDIFKTTLRTGTYDIVTPGRSLSDTGTLEGDITITIPTTFPIADELGKVLSDEFPATDVLPKIGVTPVDIADDKVIGKDMTITDAIEDAKTESPAIPAPAPGASEFDLGLASFFPFCIPFDFANFVKVLKAEPEAPSFKFKFVVGKNSKGFIYEEYTISLEQFDTVAYWCRKFELLVFIVGLMLVTRSKFIRS